MTSSEVLGPEDPGEFLRQYASKYYDPVKAHQYYLRTRVLTGRKPAQALSKESKQKQREGVQYVRKQVQTARDAELTKSAKAQTARLKALQDGAQKRRDAIVEKLQKRVEELRAQAEGIEKNAISSTANPKLKAFLAKQNAYRTNKANAQASSQAREAAVAAQAEMRKVGEDLRTSVKKARESYAAARKEMAARYSKDLKSEVQNIQNKVR